jgi:hypothetical protein
LSRLLLTLLIVLCAGTAALAAVPAQDPGLPPEDPRNRPAGRPNFTNRINVRIEQAVDREDPILERRLIPSIQGQDDYGNEYKIDATTLYRMPERRPEISTPVISIRVSSLRFASLGGSGISNRFDPPVKPPEIPGRPRPDQDEDIVTDPFPSDSQPLFVSGSGTSDSDTPLISGPELDFTLIDRIDQYRNLRWLPEGTSIHAVGRVQFGSLELFGEKTKLQMYSVGPRLALPFHRTESFELSAEIFGGVAFVKTGIGEATGLDVGLGLTVEQKLTAGISLYGAVEAELFVTEGTSAFGPAFNAGLRMGF